MNRWKLARYERGVGVDEVASETGVSRSTIYRLEKDRAGDVSAAKVKALADYYGVSVAEVLGVEERAA